MNAWNHLTTSNAIDFIIPLTQIVLLRMSLIPILQSIQTDIQENFSELNEEQLNWKPSEDKWSIAQCVEHLILSNERYFPIFDRLLLKGYKPSFWERVSPFSNYFGKIMVKTLGPIPKKKYNAPKILKPSSSRIGKAIILSFGKQQERLKNYYTQLEQLITDKIIISSPVTSLITYSLDHCLQIIAAHQQRHLNQAMNVKEHPGFP